MIMILISPVLYLAWLSITSTLHSVYSKLKCDVVHFSFHENMVFTFFGVDSELREKRV